MTEDEIMQMALEAGVLSEWHDGGLKWSVPIVGNLHIRIQRFAALVAAAAKEEMLLAGNDEWLEEARKAEREECAKVCEELSFTEGGPAFEAKRQRDLCAAAIRARGNGEVA